MVPSDPERRLNSDRRRRLEAEPAIVSEITSHNDDGLGQGFEKVEAAAHECGAYPLTLLAQAARALLAAGVRPERAVVARRLAMSERSMQRGLEAEGTTFRAVRESVLRELVEAMLSNPALKLDAVALSVGFGDLAAFSKAFRRWTGCTPARYRTQLAASGGQAHQRQEPAS